MKNSFYSRAKVLAIVVSLLLTALHQVPVSAQNVSIADGGFENKNIFKTVKQELFLLRITGDIPGIFLISLSIPTNGSYTSSDIDSFELYYNNTDDFESATLISTVSSSSGNGETINFTGFSQEIDDSFESYFYLSADINPAAITGRTFFITFFPFTNFGFSTSVGLNSSSYGSSGLRTIQPPPAQSITFRTELLTRAVGDPPFRLEAVASSGLPVSFTSSNTEVASIDANNFVVINGAGRTTIRARQGGNGTFGPAEVEKNLLVIVSGNESAASLATQLYPNPASREVEVVPAQLFGAVTYRLQSAQGHTLWQERRGDALPFRFSVEALPKGIYFLHIQNAQESFVKKIVKD